METINLKSALIAPCGMNCGLCLGYQREINHCPGCRVSHESKPTSCRNCIIINCSKLTSKKNGYCFSCKSFPCRRVKALDLRYRTKYGMSMIENLIYIKENGIRKFVKNEKERWACPECGQLVCVHRPNCLNCGAEKK